MEISNITITHQDIALPIAWPDQTARGDEKWMRILKQIGLVKNLNFKVGHAAIVLVNRTDGQLRYFDFGRYITPRGYGRARSAIFDPRLKLNTLATFDAVGNLSNLDEILTELSRKKEITHGSGRLICSICPGISFAKGVAFAEALVESGPVKYGAIARKNNSCSRYVAQIMVCAMQKNDPRIWDILYPECIKASPTSNVVNGAAGKTVYCYADDDGKAQQWKMNRLKSLSFQLKLLKDNFTTTGARRLSDDRQAGQILEPIRGAGISSHAQWLGGIGEGKWFSLDIYGDCYRISRHDTSGKLDYTVSCTPEKAFDYTEDYEFTFDVHHRRHVLRQRGNLIAFLTRMHGNVEVKELEIEHEFVKS